MSTPINITSKEIDWITIITFTWAIDESNADDTFKKIFSVFFWSKLIFDIWWLTYWNSKFMWYINKMYDYIQEKEWNFYLANIINPLNDYLEAVWILLVIPNTKTVEEAIEQIKIESK